MKVYLIPLRLTLIITILSLIAMETRAQGVYVQANVRSVSGIAQMYLSAQSAPLAIKRNAPLEPGNIIETAVNGRVVISFTDGGQITILPKSKVELKNFRVPHTGRELIDILLGRVVVKIRSLGGKPNPYRVNSPAASIAVRGTEFLVDVLTGGDTVVVVREGQVEVWPHNNPGNKRLINPGGRVIVRPGGDISSAFPGPGSELKGRTRFYGNLEDDYQRSVDSVAHNSNEIAPVFFSAFADPHFDSLENPAYAADFKNAEGRLLLLPSISAPYNLLLEVDPKSADPSIFDYTVVPQLTFFTPIPGSRLVIGGGASTLRTSLHDLTHFQFPDYKYYDSKTLKLNAYNVSLTAAYKFGEHGRTSAGISIDRLSGDGTFLSEYRAMSEGINYEYLGNSNSRFERTSLTLGLVHRFSESNSGSNKIGLYYRHGFSSSNQNNLFLKKFEDQFFLDGWNSRLGKTELSGISSELGVRFRAPLTRRVFYGVEGSYLSERIQSRREMLNQPIVQNRFQARRARLGGGIGYFPTSKILLNFDVTGGLFYNTEPVELLPDFFSSFFALAPISPKSSRGRFISTHAAIQTNPWRNLFLSASNLATFRRDSLNFKSSDVFYRDMYKYNSQLSNAGIGWNFKPGLAIEYLLSVDHRYLVPSHSLKLRYTFTLGITGEN